MLEKDTIAAIATPSGKGGVGIIRLSGPKAFHISQCIHFQNLEDRYAKFCHFYQSGKKDIDNLLDEGLAIYFKAPHSFTGEDVVELQGHGGPVILNALLQECINHGARIARPGEFSERAFLNDKMDLTQAEAIADLIESQSLAAAKNAIRSLQGEFSSLIHVLVDQCIKLRMYVEAAIDFPEEEIDFLSDQHVADSLNGLIKSLEKTLTQAEQGKVLQEGISIVIAGKPNAGKSSLLNALSGQESAIVTEIEGTTRDIVKEQIIIDGLPIHIIDTAGLRESDDVVERIGIERALKAIGEADDILWVRDSQTTNSDDITAELPLLADAISDIKHLTIINNKCDLSQQTESLQSLDDKTIINISAKTGAGLDLLKQHLKAIAGLHQATESSFTARGRHLTALSNALQATLNGQEQLINIGAGELLAEDLRQAQQYLSEITGAFTADDLLGEIFSSFCIGK